MATCPNGHDSAADDYCDVCGARIGGTPTSSTPPAPSAPPDPPAGPAGDPATGDVTCPHCGITQDTGHRFCEVCGADLATGSAGPTPVTPPVSPPADAPPASAPSWRAVVAPDRAYFDRLGVDGVEFPVAAPPRTFPLTDATVLVGRRSERRGIHPQIDLSGAPEDPGVSHAHCSLVRQPDGSYAVVDNGSTNGTFVNEATAPIEPNRPVALADGDRVHLGAYTTITLARA